MQAVYKKQKCIYFIYFLKFLFLPYLIFNKPLIFVFKNKHTKLNCALKRNKYFTNKKYLKY